MSTCDHICRECGQVMNCQHCRPYQLPVDRARIAELSVALEWALRRVPDHYKATPAFAECERALATRGAGSASQTRRNA